MFNLSLTFGEENLGVEERKGKKRNEKAPDASRTRGF